MRRFSICTLVFCAFAIFGWVGAVSSSEGCFEGNRQQARESGQQRLGFVCQGFCRGCGCKGGPGYRKSNGQCATIPDIAGGACGSDPAFSKCSRECAPLMAGCQRANLPAVTPPLEIDRGLRLIEVTGEDARGKRAAFDVIVIADGLTWASKSNDIARGRSGVTGSMLQDFIAVRFAGARDIIGAGTASSEGARTEEEKRARGRGIALSKMAMNAVSGAMVWTLNLGQHLGKCPTCNPDQTAYQRPVLLIGVIYTETGDVNIGEALKSAFARQPELPKAEAYSLFELTPAK
jgi:hypothetical protein